MNASLSPSPAYGDDECAAALARIASGNAPFAIIKHEQSDDVVILEGEVVERHKLDELHDGEGPYGVDPGIHSIHAIPYAQIREKGFEVDDDTPIMSLIVQRETRVHIQRLLSMLPDVHIEKSDPRYSSSDEVFTGKVASAKEAIANGEGSSFTISRKAFVDIKDYSREKLLSMFRSLNINEFGSYMNFVFHTGKSALIGASPERHVTAENGNVIMHPISGTLRKFPHIITKEKLLEFLNDPKEIMELFRVLDEELKQMAQMCARGGKVVGPFLKEMSKVFHTFFELVGHSDKDPVELFRLAMHPPTVISSPLYQGPRIVAALEDGPRRYYAGGIAMTGRDRQGSPYLDSAITIRTAEVADDGRVTFQAGATVVAESIPGEETQETHGKLRGPMNALFNTSSDVPKPLMEHLMDEEVRAALRSRISSLSDFHLNDQESIDRSVDTLEGKTVTIINNEDDFCYMLQHMIARMGAVANVVRFDEYDYAHDTSDIVIVGPGTGNPDDGDDPKMQKILSATKHLMNNNRPFLSICLGHQILCKELGMQLRKKDIPTQGVQRTIEYFDTAENVAFYNSFEASGSVPAGIDSCSDPDTGEIHAVRGANFASMQFHPESVLTTNGYNLLASQLAALVQK